MKKSSSEVFQRNTIVERPGHQPETITTTTIVENDPTPIVESRTILERPGRQPETATTKMVFEEDLTPFPKQQKEVVIQERTTREEAFQGPTHEVGQRRLYQGRSRPPPMSRYNQRGSVHRSSERVYERSYRGLNHRMSARRDYRPREELGGRDAGVVTHRGETLEPLLGIQGMEEETLKLFLRF